MDPNVNIRPATLDDAADILAIYAPFIESTAVTFEYTVPTLEEFRDRMASIMADYPYLVAEEAAKSSREDPEGEIGPSGKKAEKDAEAKVQSGECVSGEAAEAHVVGYAYAHRMGQRAAFQWNAELAIYLAPEARGRGLGARLVTQLEEELSAMGVRNLFSLITADNQPSIRLHEKLGFSQVGYHPSAGYKLGRWHDLIYLRKAIGSFEGEPEPIDR